MPRRVAFTSVLLSTVFGLAVASDGVSRALLLQSKTELFLSAPSFAVVGASGDESKFGTIVFKTMLDRGLDVVPINPFAPFSYGKPCVNALADLPDPKRTSISVITQPSVTLNILRQAAELGVFAVWLQPGAEDHAVLEFIASANNTGTTFIHSLSLLARESPDTVPSCMVGNVDTPDIISTLAS
ncbi:hypothetical protein C8F01DRAFT_977622 [Mycena amicta]|nr:hypothetical protein C8F01DRAFT_977622 [Mycena amicta]